MFDDTRIASPFEKKASRRVGGIPTLEALEEEARRDREERRRLRWMVVIAAFVHAVLLVVSFPQIAAKPKTYASGEKKVFVVQQVKFRPPAPRPKQVQKKERAKKKIPIPDPTPDDPEPIIEEDEEIEVADIDVPIGDFDVFEIPDAPPGGFGPPGNVMQIGDGVSKPVRVYTPQPQYTEEARASRIQGTVIVQGVVDAEGNVGHLQVLKGLPLGLSESAMETLETWKYEPARKNGEPVAVYYIFTVNFSLQ